MRRALLPVILACAGLAASCAYLVPPREKTQRSFVIIAIDSLRADHVGAYGYGRATTPRIDALARDGVVFTRAWSQAPWTKPSVASIFTSTYISVHRVLYSKQVLGGQSRADILNEKFLTLAEAMSSAGFATAAFGKKVHLRPDYGFAQGFDAFDMNVGGAPRVNEAALGWLRGEDPDRFFMYIHLNDAHYPYTHRPETARFAGGEPRVQIVGETKRAFRDGSLRLSESDVADLVDLYDDEILYTDRYVGELVDGFAKLGYGNVLVVVTADHGEEFMDHGDITHGQSLYDELVRVPLVVAGSGLPSSARGKTVDAETELIDLMPTILNLAGLPRPPLVQGKSFAGLLADRGASDPPRPAFSERRDPDETEFSRSALDGRWKLVLDATHGRTLLFDIGSDPGERQSVVEENPGVVEALTARLAAWSAANVGLHGRIGPDSTAPLDPELEEKLRSLGYVE